MENILLVKIQANVNQRKHTLNNRLSKVSHYYNREVWPSKWEWLFCIRNYFSFPGWTSSYIFGYSNAKFQPVRSWITRFLYAGFHCMKNIYENYGVKNYIKEDHRNYRRNFCSCEKQKQIYSWLPITRALPLLTRTSRHVEPKSISPGFPSIIYCNFTLGNSNPR